jgi:hypothetical protein
MQFLAVLFTLLVAAYAQQNPNFTVDVGGSNPPITFPQVTTYNNLNGPYKHVIILSLDGFHQVFPGIE